MDYHISITEDGITRYPMHQHSFSEIMLYLEGTGFLRTEKGNIPFERGTAIIVPAPMMHGSVSEKGFKNISLGGIFENLLLFDQPVCIKATEDSSVLCKLIYGNRFSDSLYLNALVDCYLSSLMQSVHSASQIDRAIDGIMKAVSQNALNPDFSIREALHLSGYAEDYIRAKFKEKTGKTPTEFVNTVRIAHACKLMDIYGKELSVSALSEKCGFASAPYFSRVFKKIKQISPAQYSRCAEDSGVSVSRIKVK